MWDQMYRATLPYGRKGVAIHAISAVDLALWDALGRWRNEPVYAMLGGQTKVPPHCLVARPAFVQLPCAPVPARLPAPVPSLLTQTRGNRIGTLADLCDDSAPRPGQGHGLLGSQGSATLRSGRRVARRAKVPLARHRTWHEVTDRSRTLTPTGGFGVRRNLAFLEQCRQQVGPHFPLMIDCYMSVRSIRATAYRDPSLRNDNFIPSSLDRLARAS